jgi:hypothetical protein
VASRLTGLTDTKEGRLAIIIVVGGVLVVGGAIANVAMGNLADDRAAGVRRALRHDLAAVSDETLAAYPASRPTVESLVVQAVRDLPARVVGSAQPADGGPVLVAVETRWGLQARCVTAELRGDATVLTEVAGGAC